MGHHFDLRFRHPVLVQQDFPRLPAHHHQPVGQAGQVLHHLLLAGTRLPEHGVQGGHDRHPEPRQQFEDIGAVVTAENTVLVLEADGVDLVYVEKIRCQPVIAEALLVQLETNLFRVAVPGRYVVHRQRPEVDLRRLLGERLVEIVSKSSDAALPRQERANQSNSIRTSTIEGTGTHYTSPLDRCCGPNKREEGTVLFLL